MKNKSGININIKTANNFKKQNNTNKRKYNNYQNEEAKEFNRLKPTNKKPKNKQAQHHLPFNPTT